ncbi:ribosomal protein S18-alanine N-acetyltransferase [Thiomicrospira sp. ALE5]|uniref:ribosomal protein S18-alanine N-acetyltransferase n=1 Tax=Thiomicrospira sp. ALE5 TaxID=748650 RepID=UPI0008E9AF07|nr:ribosomal protein S18-alanine N-acetyltransferase [Thiomicrospira sp. ALE5]SFR63121.1 ribosomal-protein-alanine N-acetyltransferase [Thiomicrospira sp. ALE5]
MTYIDLTRPVKLPVGMKLTAMVASDLVSVVELEQKNALMPWSLRSFELSLSNRQGNWVVYRETELVGFVCASVILDELHILNLSVAQTCRGQGIATALIMQLCAAVNQEPIRKIFLEVRQSNKVAQKLYRKLGFCSDGIRKGYYQSTRGTREDALLMSRDF